MEHVGGSHFTVVIVCVLFSFTSLAADTHEDFIQCLYLNSHNSTSISKVVYTQTNSSYSSILKFSIQNLRFASNTTPKPLVIVTPLEVSHIQVTVFCSQSHGMQIRTRSGGHDYEGLSYVSEVPFVMIDLINYREIEVDVENSTAWVQAGATVGELYYRISQKSKNLGFPAAADNIIDAHIIDVKGRLLDRESMGEDLFWAIRGGGGASFGVILAWKVKLVPVPSTVTVCTVPRTLEQNATELIHKWQLVANKLHEDITINIILQRVNSSEKGKLIVQALFNFLFLGGVDKLIPLMQERFPELGLVREDCTEMSWIESVLYFFGFPIGSLEILLNRTQTVRGFFKAKSDYVRNPIPEIGLEGIWPMFDEDVAQGVMMELFPYGGIMDKISESEIPFPHRYGNLYMIQYSLRWLQEGDEVAQRHISWIRRLYSYMEPFVSKSPRAAYFNYRDLDIGVNNEGYTSYKQASIWGLKYFKNNFKRLAHVKTKVDPFNFFRNEQSIPSLLWKGHK
ncbi:tetrahydroberberine oxidase-like [Gastrolobium bilobum]|uniref:tetrahydroberberine oxidase-like n=1 Tax=Gastrolobium bilobum TaxID=150636 RepID=UPI002AB18721|nr:tetrahydroberberine oxidase-like [Gastrolobium bilobum]